MLKLSIILSFYCFWLFCIMICNGEYKKCYLDLFDCPEKTTCIQESNDQGECTCNPGYVFNIIYKNYTDYCLPITVTKKSDETTTNNATVTTMNLQKNPPSSHHIIGGIFIPIIVVLIFIGVYFGIKKIGVISRIREYISRRRQPFYEDVNLTLDEPPLV